MRRIKASDVSAVTQAILKVQNKRCPLCGLPVGPGKQKGPALDHDHDTGYIRGVLCINCNGVEGKIRNLTRRVGKHTTKMEVLRNLLKYWELHEVPQYGGVFHHTYKTPQEVRLERLKKAAAKRKAAKESK